MARNSSLDGIGFKDDDGEQNRHIQIKFYSFKNVDNFLKECTEVYNLCACSCRVLMHISLHWGLGSLRALDFA